MTVRALKPDTDAVDKPQRSLIIALTANAIAAAIKLAVFALTGSSVLLSEGLHSLADCGNEIALLTGHRHSSAAPSSRRLIGRSQARYLWAFLAAVVVFGGSAVGSVAEATYRLVHPEEVGHFTLIAWTLVATMVVEVASFAAAATEAQRNAGKRGWLRYVTASADPDLPVLLVEDAADMVGLVLAFAGSALAAFTGVAAFDVAASYLIGLLLAANAVFLARTMGRLLLSGAVEVELDQVVFGAVGSSAVGRDLISVCRVRSARLGPEELLFAIDVVIDPTLTAADIFAEIHAARARVKIAVPSARHVFFDCHEILDPTDQERAPDRVQGEGPRDSDGPSCPPALPSAL